ncbi:hypothetical protein KCU87_g89, partial [Aureobasidium melanogenum]
MSVVFARLASVFAGSIDFAISENSDEAMSRDRKRHETERREETRAALPLSLFLAPNRQYRRATPLDSELLQRRPRILLRSGPRNGCPDSRSWSGMKYSTLQISYLSDIIDSRIREKNSTMGHIAISWASRNLGSILSK